MKFLLITFSLTLSFLFEPTAAKADEIACPKRIASFLDMKLLAAVTPVMKKVYSKLGCTSTEFVSVPLRRALLQFNNEEVDGEVLRIRGIEKAYKVSFVKSSTPVVLSGGSLWERPNVSDVSKSPIAYQLGIVWHEQYISEKNALQFYGNSDIAKVYNSGKINRFLGTNFWVAQLVKSQKLTPSPVLKEEIVELRMYHYLNETYAPFMTLFSNYIKSEQSFLEFSE